MALLSVYLSLSPIQYSIMLRTLLLYITVTEVAAIDEILNLMHYCDRMSVVKTRWFGENAGRRFRGCEYDNCGFSIQDKVFNYGSISLIVEPGR